MIDVQTYRQRIGSAIGILTKILGRKAARLSFCENETHHQDEDLLRKVLKNVTVFQISYLLLVLLVIAVNVIKHLASLQAGKRTEYIYHVHSECLVQLLQRIYYRVPVFNGSDALLTEGTLVVFFTALCLSSIGAVHFIAILLLIAGIEPNPGPKHEDDSLTSNASKIPTAILSPTSSESTVGDLHGTSRSRTISDKQHYPIRSKIPILAPCRDFPKNAAMEDLSTTTSPNITQSTQNQNTLQYKQGTEPYSSRTPNTKDDKRETIRAQTDQHSTQRQSYVGSDDFDPRTSTPDITMHRTFCCSVSPPCLSSIDEGSVCGDVKSMECTLVPRRNGGLDLNLTEKNLTSEQMDTLLQILVEFQPSVQVKKLDMSGSKYQGNVWSKSEEDFEYLERLIEQPRLQTVSVVNLDKCRLQKVPQALAGLHHRLQKLSISHNQVSELTLPILACKRLEGLWVSCNLITG